MNHQQQNHHQTRHLSKIFFFSFLLQQSLALITNNNVNSSTLPHSKRPGPELILIIIGFIITFIVMQHLFFGAIDFLRYLSFKIKSRAARSREKKSYSAQNPEVIVVGAGVAGT
jgi:hypothetical protein